MENTRLEVRREGDRILIGKGKDGYLHWNPFENPADVYKEIMISLGFEVNEARYKKVHTYLEEFC